MWNLDKYSDRVAVIEESGRTVTYTELSQNASEIKHVISKRCLCLIVCKNSTNSQPCCIGSPPRIDNLPVSFTHSIICLVVSAVNCLPKLKS